MKIKLGELRKVIREEALRGVPDFVLRKYAEDCTEQVRASVKRFIMQRSENPMQQRQLIATATPVLEELEEELFDLIQEKLSDFMYRI